MRRQGTLQGRFIRPSVFPHSKQGKADNVYIHPMAIVSPKAKIGRDVQIGPFCVIEDDVVITEDGCEVLSPQIIKQPDEIEAYMAEHNVFLR